MFITQDGGDMNMNPPKKLIGQALVDHIVELDRHWKSGGMLEVWIDHRGEWVKVTIGTLWNWPLWHYRKQPTKIVRWVNHYPSHSVVHVSLDLAKAHADGSIIARTRVEFYEGQFDE